jgi:hypothetical protein
MDLLEFVNQGGYVEKFAKKPLVGLEVALASDCMFAKQADMKLANLIIIETATNYVVATIDHEMSGKGLHAKRVFTTHIDKLISRLRDVNEAITLGSNDNLDLADNQLAEEFIAVAKPYMQAERIIDFYRQVAQTEHSRIISIIDEIDGRDGLIDLKEGDHYAHELVQISKEAQLFLKAYDQSQRVTDTPSPRPGLR